MPTTHGMMMNDKKLIVNNLCKSFMQSGNSLTDGGSELQVLDNLTFSVCRGEFVTLFGPNGCGKTTILNIIANVLQDYSGSVMIGDKTPSEARIGYIFQNYDDSLFPWAKAWENISFPLRLNNQSPKNCKKAVDMLTSQLDISLPLDSYPYQLSGGQKQLVAICRALLFEPDLLIMDEPFSALDHEARFLMQEKIQRLWREKELTILFVSHEIDEAVFLADRLLIMTKRPAQIWSEQIINLPRPRSHKLLEDKQFFASRAAALKSFGEVMAK